MNSSEDNMDEIYAEDIVLKYNASRKSVASGVISDIYSNLDDYISDDDDSDFLKPGQARIAWHPRGNEDVNQLSQVFLADRSLVPGDVVGYADALEPSLKGCVLRTQILCVVRIYGTNKVMWGIDSSLFTPVKPWVDSSKETFVGFEGWIGEVMSNEDCVTLCFPDGAICKIARVYMDDFVDVNSDDMDDESYFGPPDFFEGQQLKVISCALKNATWLVSTSAHSATAFRKKSNFALVYCTIVKIETKLLEVHWICCNPGVATKRPPRCISGAQLEMIHKVDCFMPSRCTVGDLLYYTVQPGVTVTRVPRRFRKHPMTFVLKQLKAEYEHLTSTGATTKQASSYDKIPPVRGLFLALMASHKSVGSILSSDGELSDSSAKWCSEDDNENASDAITSTKASKDAFTSGASTTTEQRELDSTCRRARLLRKRRFTVRQLHKKTQNVKSANKWQRFGLCDRNSIPVEQGIQVCVEVLHTCTFVEVMWQDSSTKADILSIDLVPIQNLDETDFFPGDCVAAPSTDEISGMKVDNPPDYGVVSKVTLDRTVFVSWIYSLRGEVKTSTPEELSVYDVREHPVYKFRPGDVIICLGTDKKQGAGEIANCLPNGQLGIRHSDGTLHYSYPHQVIPISDRCNLDDESMTSSSIVTTSSDDDSDNNANSDDGWETDQDTNADVDNRKHAEELSSLLLNCSTGLKTTEQLKSSTIVAPNMSSVDGLTALLAQLKTSFSYCQTLSSMFDDNPYRADKRVRNVLKGIKKYKKLCKQIKKSANLQEIVSGVWVKNCKSSEPVNANSTDRPAEEQNATTTTINNTSVTTENSDAVAAFDQAIIDDITSLLETAILTLRDLVEILDALSTSCIDQLKCAHNTNDTAQDNEANHFTMPPGSSQLIESHFHSNVFNVLNFLVVPNSASEVTPNGDASNNEAVTNDIKSTSKADEAIAEHVPPTGEINDKADHSHEQDTKLSEEDKACDDVELTNELSKCTCGSNDQQSSNVKAHSELGCKGELLWIEAVPEEHKFFGKRSTSASNLHKIVHRELKLLQSNLPPGIIVKAFEDEMDLFSVCIVGPSNTPYEDALFFFDFALPLSYPSDPPLCRYWSFCHDRLNPNLYEDGKVCVSLLGTWSGKGSEEWVTGSSNLLQVLISVQGLILVDEPYYNEAGFDNLRQSQKSSEASRVYNEMAVIKTVQSMIGMIKRPVHVFESEIRSHYHQVGRRIVQRLLCWCDLEGSRMNHSRPESSSPTSVPKFPLLPVSRGFVTSLQRCCLQLYEALISEKICTAAELPMVSSEQFHHSD